MLNCRNVTKLCSEELERDLSLQERIGLRMHLLMCGACRNFRDQMRFLRAAFRRFSSGRAPHSDDADAGGNVDR